MSLRFGIVAGEASGDLLGAGLMASMRARVACSFEGICGPAMIALGGLSRYPMEALSVMGISEVVGRLPALIRIRRELIRYFRETRPDCVIGIDSPDFTLALERALKADGIPVVHYVSPTVWAWRRYRVRTVARSADLLLTLFPFEPAYYAGKMNAIFVGHPLADMVKAAPDTQAARTELRLETKNLVIALLPGSRESELKAHAEMFVRTAMRLALRYPGCQFIAPFVNRQTRDIFERVLTEQKAFDLPITRLHGHARLAMAASDIVLCASGTAALEAALVGRPMVVTYRLSGLSYWLMRSLSHLDYYSLPNHLAGRALVPELIQRDATADQLVKCAEQLIEDPDRRTEMVAAFGRIRETLRQGANDRAAGAVLNLIGARAEPQAALSCGS
ncbi:MAG TPA: lipid-A-disaccharide synthase [Acidiferrobacter sp.]|nr:lipid-A-disaccharide synthase [Acidiferrobacter sp.]